MKSDGVSHPHCISEQHTEAITPPTPPAAAAAANAAAAASAHEKAGTGPLSFTTHSHPNTGLNPQLHPPLTHL